MTVVQRPAVAALERIAGTGDMPQVQLGAAENGMAAGRMIETGEGGGLFLHPLEERRVLDQRHLHRFGQAGDLVAAAEAGEQLEVVDHGGGGVEGAQQVFLAEGIDAVLHADAGVVLRQHRARQADQTNAAVEGGAGVTHRIQQGAAAHGQHVAVPVEAVLEHVGVQLLEYLRGLALLTGCDGDRRGQQVQVAGMAGEPGFDLSGQLRSALQQLLVGEDQHRHPAVLPGGELLVQAGVAQVEQMIGKAHRIVVADLEAAVQHLRRGGFAQLPEQAVAGDEQPRQDHAGEERDQQSVLLDEDAADGAVGQGQAHVGQGRDQDEGAQRIALHAGGDHRGLRQYRHTAQADQRQGTELLPQLSGFALMQAKAAGQHAQVAGAQGITQPGAEAQAHEDHQVATDAAQGGHGEQRHHARRHRQHDVQCQQGDQQQGQVGFAGGAIGQVQLKVGQEVLDLLLEQ